MIAQIFLVPRSHNCLLQRLGTRARFVVRSELFHNLFPFDFFNSCINILKLVVLSVCARGLFVSKMNRPGFITNDFFKSLLSGQSVPPDAKSVVNKPTATKHIDNISSVCYSLSSVTDIVLFSQAASACDVQTSNNRAVRRRQQRRESARRRRFWRSVDRRNRLADFPWRVSLSGSLDTSNTTQPRVLVIDAKQISRYRIDRNVVQMHVSVYLFG